MIRELKFTPQGARDFEKLPFEIRKRIREKLTLYLDSGSPMSFTKPLVNLPPATHRFRVGKYRILVYLDGSNIVIDGVDTRSEAYRRR